jgi:hypothetical protein
VGLDNTADVLRVRVERHPIYGFAIQRFLSAFRFQFSVFSFQFSDALLPQARVVPRNAARAIENMSPIGLAPGWFQTVSSGEFLV